MVTPDEFEKMLARAADDFATRNFCGDPAAQIGFQEGARWASGLFDDEMKDQLRMIMLLVAEAGGTARIRHTTLMNLPKTITRFDDPATMDVVLTVG